jgi:predicted RND superfamily exporter protein
VSGDDNIPKFKFDAASNEIRTTANKIDYHSGDVSYTLIVIGVDSSNPPRTGTSTITIIVEPVTITITVEPVTITITDEPVIVEPVNEFPLVPLVITLVILVTIIAVAAIIIYLVWRRRWCRKKQ